MRGETVTRPGAAGGVGSMTVNVVAALEPAFPAASTCVATAVYVPSASAVASTAKAPVPDAASRSGSAAARRRRWPGMDPDRDVALSPAAVPPTPLRVGVGSPVVDPLAGLVRVTAGAARSTVRVRVADGSLPMPSDDWATSAGTAAVTAPSAIGVSVNE